MTFDNCLMKVQKQMRRRTGFEIENKGKNNLE